MGKRKSTRAQPKRQKEKLPKVFDCLFCNNIKSVKCYLDQKAQTGIAQCRLCKEAFRTTINSLSEEIDVYTEWFDECERVNK